MIRYILIILALLSFNIFAERYKGGYVNGKWYAFYNNNYIERNCIDGFENEPLGGCGHQFPFLLQKIELSVIGVAEIKNKENDALEILLKVSDFKIEDSDYEGEIYTPYAYPVPPEKKGKPYFPKFSSIPKDEFLKFLKDNNKNLKFNNKEWVEEYEGKKVKFSGVEIIKLNLFGSFYREGNEIWISCVGFWLD